MMRFLGIGLITGFLFVCATVVVLNWVVNEDPAKFFSSTSILDVKEDGIERVEMEMSEQTLSLNVFLNKPLTCSHVIDTLGIVPLIVNNKTYSPSCYQKTNNLLKITYIETVSI